MDYCIRNANPYSNLRQIANLPQLRGLPKGCHNPKSVIRVYARLVFVMFHDTSVHRTFLTWSRHRKRAFSALVFRNDPSILATSLAKVRKASCECLSATARQRYGQNAGRNADMA